jgi:16S rRNA (guanine966-N2)-methyltransferase
MRISAGKHKNRKIVTALKSKGGQGEELHYRPTSERTRQAIFNIIENSSKISEHILKNAVVADICCGSGSFGLEALSRGAKRVYFIDASLEQIELVKFNIESIKETPNAHFIKARIPAIPLGSEKCDIIFIDPPYWSKLIPETLVNLASNGWLAENHVIIIELSKREEPVLTNEFEIFDLREYGKTKLIFCRLRR